MWTIEQTEEARTPRDADGEGRPPRQARERLMADLPVQERRLQLAGVVTPILEGGEGPPVVLLHGPGEHAPKWLRVLPELTTTHRVVAPDLPGHGASEIADARSLDAERTLASLVIRRTE